MWNIRSYWINRTTVNRLTIPILCAAALLVACDSDREPTGPTPSLPDGGFEADLVGSTLSYLTAQLFLLQPLIPDGSLIFSEPPEPGNTIHVVDRDNKGGWKIQIDETATVTFDDETTCGAAEPPQPPGALHLLVTTGDQGARLRSTRYHRTYLRDLTRLDYHACDEVNNGQQWPYILLTVDWDGNNTIDDLIFFEPAYQNPAEGGTCGVASNQGPEVIQTWQFWDALRKDPTDGTFRACYWALSSPIVGGVGTVGCGPGTFVCSLSEYIAQHQDAAIVNLDGNHGGVQIVHGFASPGDAFDGWVDAFTIGKDLNKTNSQSNSTITYDFEKP